MTQITPHIREERNVLQLLKKCTRAGTRSLADVAHSALSRHLKGGAKIENLHRFFDERELRHLGRTLRDVNGTAHQLGRAGMRTRANQFLHHERTTPFELFSEYDYGTPIMSPDEAVDYFKGLIPGFRDDPDPEFQDNLDRHGFTLAVTSDNVVLQRVKRSILKRLETGQGISSAPKEIGEILTSAGVSLDNPSYPEMVFRTNMMESYRKGHWKEFMDPDLKDEFPAWKYIGIHDGRERHGPLPKPDHRRWFGKLFPRDVSFFKVRGEGIEDTACCRCVPNPIYRMDLYQLQKNGAKFTSIPGITK